jgi:hypothetical protein
MLSAGRRDRQIKVAGLAIAAMGSHNPLNGHG